MDIVLFSVSVVCLTMTSNAKSCLCLDNTLRPLKESNRTALSVLVKLQTDGSFCALCPKAMLTFSTLNHYFRNDYTHILTEKCFH